MRDKALHGCAGRKVREAAQCYAVAFLYRIVVRGIAERQRKQALLLQIRFVDPREAARDHRGAAKEPRY
jgi:hypothetical protein